MSEFKGRPLIENPEMRRMSSPEEPTFVSHTPETPRTYERGKHDVMAALQQLGVESTIRTKNSEQLQTALNQIMAVHSDVFSQPERSDDEEEFDEPAIIAQLVAEYSVHQPNGREFKVSLREVSSEKGKRLTLMFDELPSEPRGKTPESTQVVRRRDIPLAGEGETLVPEGDEPTRILEVAPDTFVPEEPTRVPPSSQPRGLWGKLLHKLRRS